MLTNTKPLVVAAEELSDEEIYQMALEDWLGILAKLWTAFGKPLDPEALQIYREMLAGVPIGLLEKAITRVIREHRFATVPTIAEVWTAIRKELGNPVIDLDQAIEGWCERVWESAFYRFETVTTETAEDNA